MFKSLIIVLALSFFSFSPVSASGFQLKSIGALDVTGAVSQEWWYSTANPQFSGLTTVGSTVTVKIDAVDYQATVDGVGNWTYTPSTLTEGDHAVSLNSSAGAQSFTLHIGQNIPAEITAPTPKDLPVVGSIDQTMWLLLGSLFILAAGVIILPAKK
ncbi:MAG: Ig-like domain-containing protein [Patescibacteria group bacterium]|nr:Ig-like domain-containing protein [Patescibacteria group bacterium]